MKDKTSRSTTALLHAGRPRTGWVNTPVTRGSTFIYENVQAWRDVRSRREKERLISYGARGNDTSHALEDALIELEGGYRASLFPTGQAAIAVVLSACLKAGDHVLVTDGVYEPVRRFCTEQLPRMGVAVTYFKADGSDIAEKLRPETRLIYGECPASLTYDMLDLPAVAELAQRHGNCLVAMDNTWGSGWLYRPLALGADISVMAATKYLGGHADVMMGTAVANERAWPALQNATINFGQTVSADDAYLVLRGLRSLPLRLAAHQRHALEVAQWLLTQPEVAQVFCPALPHDPNHALWARDCHGTNGLISVEFTSTFSAEDLEGLIDSLSLFGLGASWGGFESLVIPGNLRAARSLTSWEGRGPVLRFHIGLEDPSDLIADLKQGLATLPR